jgi:hypothetical protein
MISLVALLAFLASCGCTGERLLQRIRTGESACTESIPRVGARGCSSPVFVALWRVAPVREIAEVYGALAD